MPQYDNTALLTELAKIEDSTLKLYKSCSIKSVHGSGIHL
jgi:hypothetical protein